MPDADLVVEVAPEAVPVVAGEVPEKKEAALPAIEPIEDLKQQFDAMKTAQDADKVALQAARDEAARERQAREAAEAEVSRAKTDLTESNVSAVDNAIAAVKAEADGFQRDQQLAYEAGDFAKAAEFGRKMARAEARMDRLEEGKANLAAEPKAVEKKEEPRRTEPPTETRSQAWLRTHPAYNVQGSSENYEAIAAHNKAMAKKITVDSDAYFDFVETELGLKPAKANGGEVKQPENRTRSMPAAPVSHDASPAGGQTSPTKVVLTPGEQRAATDGTLIYNFNDPGGKFKKGDPIGLVEMAKRKMELTKRGAYSREYTDQ